MNYLEGNIIKYVTRYKFKGGVDDLRKAEWYLKKLMLSIVVPTNDWNADCTKPFSLIDLERMPSVPFSPIAKTDSSCAAREQKQEWAQETKQAIDESCGPVCDNYIKPHFPSVKF